MTSLPGNNSPMTHKGAQLTYGEEKEFPAQSTIHPAHISYPLGGEQEVEREYRKPKRIPAVRRLVLRDESSFRNSKNSSRVTNSDRINTYAIKLAYDYLNRSYHYENKKMRSVDDVTSHLFSILADRLKPTSDYEAATSGGKGYMTYPMVERYAERAAEYAVDAWRPDYYELQARKGAKGGRKSKRKPEYTYRDFLAVEGLTHAEAAAALGVAPITVRRMRDRYKKASPVTGDFLPPAIEPTTTGPTVDELVNGL